MAADAAAIRRLTPATAQEAVARESNREAVRHWQAALHVTGVEEPPDRFPRWLLKFWAWF